MLHFRVSQAFCLLSQHVFIVVTWKAVDNSVDSKLILGVSLVIGNLPGRLMVLFWSSLVGSPCLEFVHGVWLLRALVVLLLHHAQFLQLADEMVFQVKLTHDVVVRWLRLNRDPLALDNAICFGHRASWVFAPRTVDSFVVRR